MFIQNPSKVMAQFLRHSASLSGRDKLYYDCGLLAAALEVITQIKSLESLPVVSDLGRQEAVTALQTLLVDMGIEEEAYRWYEMLGEWRKPKFAGVGHDVSPPDTSSSDGLASLRRAPVARVFADAEHRDAPSPLGKTALLLLARRRSDLDAESGRGSDDDAA